MFSSSLLALARVVLAEARSNNLRIATAESCTGGLVAACLTEIEGSSDILDRGFVVYSNRAKQDLLNVPGDLIADAGAVSEAVARAMAEGAVENSNAHLAVAVTGIAGPTGGSDGKPVGTVWLALAHDGRVLRVWQEHFGGDRHAVRGATVRAALNALCEAVEDRDA